jgi:hypothetical protein
MHEQAQQRGLLSDPEYLRARERSLALAARDGIDAALTSHRLDALIAPTASPAWLIDWVCGDNRRGGRLPARYRANGLRRASAGRTVRLRGRVRRPPGHSHRTRDQVNHRASPSSGCGRLARCELPMFLLFDAALKQAALET